MRRHGRARNARDDLRAEPARRPARGDMGSRRIALAPTRTYWGWNANGAKKVKTSTLIMAGEEDQLMKSDLELFDDLGASQKVFLGIACGTHFMN